MGGSAPIYDPPNSEAYAMTPGQYATAIKKLAAMQGAIIAHEKQVGAVKSGEVSVQGVDFSWSYDGSQALVVTILKKHSLKAKIAGNAAIFSLLQDNLY